MLCSCDRGKPFLIFGKICCFQTRTAAYVVAAVELILTLLLLFFRMKGEAENEWRLYGHGYANYSTFWKEFWDTPVEERPEPQYSHVILPTLLCTLPYIVHVIVTALLIHGLRRNRFDFMRIWLWIRFVNAIDNTVDVLSLGPLFSTDIIGLPIWIILASTSIVIVRSHLYNARTSGEFVTLQEGPKD